MGQTALQTCSLTERPDASSDDEETSIGINSDEEYDRAAFGSSALCGVLPGLGVCVTSSSVVPAREVTKVRNLAGRNTSALLKMRRGSSFAAGQGKDNPTINVPFPALLYVPSCKVITFVTICGIAVVLCLTIFEEWFLDRGVDRSKFIEYVSIPFVSVIFTYVHIWGALYLTFYPLTYRGYAQIPDTNVGLGWQGIVPNRAGEMAALSVDLMTKSLINVQEIIARIDIEKVCEELQETLPNTVTQVIDQMMQKHNQRFWQSIPSRGRDAVLQRAQRDAPLSVSRIVAKLQKNIDKYFDIKAMVVAAFTEEPELLNYMFIKCGFKELEFIRDCGARMGFFFGVLQVGLWLVYSAGWMLPAFGFVVGVFSNWLALKMIFEPVRPVRCCCLTLQGLFLQRQEEVAEIYAQIVTDNILSARNITRAILTGPLSKELVETVHEEMSRSVADFLKGPAGAVKLFRTSEQLQECRVCLACGVLEQMPDACKHIEKYVDEAMGLEEELEDKMKRLEPEAFEGLLHPVFQQDEWKLVLMGGMLGVLVGCMQWKFLGA